MLFFRSEEQVRKWCEARQETIGPLVDMQQLWKLSTTWYSNRLQENSKRPAPEEIVGIFAGLGLVGEFWNPVKAVDASLG